MRGGVGAHGRGEAEGWWHRTCEAWLHFVGAVHDWSRIWRCGDGQAEAWCATSALGAAARDRWSQERDGGRHDGARWRVHVRWNALLYIALGRFRYASEIRSSLGGVYEY